MNPEEAVRRCEWWGRNEAETLAFGSTLDPEIGLYFNGEEYDREQFTDPSKKGWAIRIPRYVSGKDGQLENALYHMIVQEIERRAQV